MSIKDCFIKVKALGILVRGSGNDIISGKVKDFDVELVRGAYRREAIKRGFGVDE